MFNLYNLLFGSSTRQEEETNLNESSSAEVVSQQLTDQCTQTTDNSASNETSINNNNNFNNSKSANHECWILVDDADEDAAVGNEKCVPSPLLNPKNDMSTSMSHSRIVSDSNNVNNHVVNNNSNVLVENKKMNVSMMDSKIVGSFFEKHQDEDEEFNRKYGTNQTNNNNWLITPLPCLTSIHASQRSIIENDPLENLLIEHPSMSVFVAATSSASNSDQSFQEEEVKEEERMIVVESEAPKPVQQSQKPKMTKSEKRKAQIQSQSSSVETSPNNNNNKRKNKKNKKSATAVSSTQSSSNVTPSSSVSNVSQNTANQNKENLQVWLANDAKKHALSQQARLEQLLFNKNQMKRANKTKQMTANHKQRKYHKLQQPSALSNNRTVF